MRASYGREDKAYNYMVGDGTYCYIAKRWVDRYVMGKRRRVLEALIPNLIFVYTTKEKAETYIKDTPEIGFLTYYYNHFELNNEQKNPPLIVPRSEMENFIRATWSHNEHILFVDPAKCHYKSGDMVRVIEGVFQGVEKKNKKNEVCSCNRRFQRLGKSHLSGDCKNGNTRDYQLPIERNSRQ